ncbi:hypothetical protein [Kitasatospora griseola]|uniref:hypothetical protein n=1 Tax=Kitasatospora griseola TaxID=2064 RepID=UPI0036467317
MRTNSILAGSERYTSVRHSYTRRQGERVVHGYYALLNGPDGVEAADAGQSGPRPGELALGLVHHTCCVRFGHSDRF